MENYEEKYNEALERAREFINQVGTHNLKVDSLLEQVFPELKESADERIRKDLISHFKETIENIRSEEIIPRNAKILVGKMQKWIAWLEKQDKKSIPENINEAALQYVDVNDKYKTMYGFESPYIKDRKYIVCCRKFEYINSAAIPCSGQIATNSRLVAKILYKLWRKWSYRNYGSMAVMLMKRNEKGTYDAIER